MTLPLDPAARLEARLERIEDKLDRRLDIVDKELDQVGSRLDRLEGALGLLKWLGPTGIGALLAGLAKSTGVW